MYFIRFTNRPTLDLERKTSIHESDILMSEMSKKEFIELYKLDKEENEIITIDNYYCELLNGLCGFECESEELQEALKELQEVQEDGIEIYDSSFEFHLFEGELSDEILPDGVLFIPSKLIK